LISQLLFEICLMPIKYSLKNKIFEGPRPFVIAGPCSVETPDQVLLSCLEISKDPRISVLRGGIWKPRTRPDSFEGVGSIGLPWLVEAGKETGLPVTTEVANHFHVEEALKAGIDILWIGARTTVNPFAVQEIADALKGVDIPIMIKNPINPDVELWIGAFERLQKAGLDDLTAIHRGFSSYKPRKYRNVPNWELPLDFQSKCPDVPMICDPSHISGRRDILLEVSQKALDLNYQGLMIETHINPEKAWSDAEQQLTPENLIGLLNSLTLRSPEILASALGELGELRSKIEILDDRLFELLSARMKLSEQVGELKRVNEITIFQQEHWSKMKNERLKKSDEYGLTEYFIRRAIEAIHQESIRHQTKVMNPSLIKKKNS
jgi:chorismate mutase